LDYLICKEWIYNCILLTAYNTKTPLGNIYIFFLREESCTENCEEISFKLLETLWKLANTDVFL